MENQNIEYKREWKDEYLSTICGFANSEGGVLYIGLSDSGHVYGVKNVVRSLDVIPKKIYSTLNYIVPVNAKEIDGKYYIEIIIPKATFAVDYNGNYYMRSGSSTFLLSGNQLQAFLRLNSSHNWEDGVVEGVCIGDLDEESFELFKSLAFSSGRIDSLQRSLSNNEIVDIYHLANNGSLTRAAILLFAKDPERYIPGAYIRVFQFRGGALAYQEEYRGSLLKLANKITGYIYKQFLHARISYNGVHRVETYQYPEPAIREALMNALIHKDYSKGIPIQIRFDEDIVTISNDSVIPFGWNESNLKSTHRSVPYNPNIANVLYRAGFVETVGQGIKKIFSSCKSYGIGEPSFSLLPSEFVVAIPALFRFVYEIESLVYSNEVKESIPKYGYCRDDSIIKAIEENPTITNSELALKIGVSLRTINRYLSSLQEKGKIRRIGKTKGAAWLIVK